MENKMARYDSILKKLNFEQCKTILEAYGFAVYQSESVGRLREVIRANMLDGTIPSDYVSGFLND
jgi:hypothetical protein